VDSERIPSLPSLNIQKCLVDDKFLATFAGAMFILIISVPLVFGFSSAITDRYKVLPFYYVLTGYLVMLNFGAIKKDAVNNEALKGDA
jgi:hypothetical protein